MAIDNQFPRLWVDFNRRQRAQVIYFTDDGEFILEMREKGIKFSIVYSCLTLIKSWTFNQPFKRRSVEILFLFFADFSNVLIQRNDSVGLFPRGCVGECVRAKKILRLFNREK